MKADKVYVNGKIYTVNENKDWAEAVAVKDGKIIFVGSDTDAEAYANDAAEVIDLEGKMMLPGFIDGHCHPVMAAHYLCGIVFDIDWTLDECLEAIKTYVAEHPDNDKYFGFGYAEWLFDEKGPNKKLLDDICADKPMYMMSSGGHEGWVNSKTFELAEITKDTPDPVPGLHYFARDDEGNPSGHVVEGQSIGMVMSKISFFDKDTIVKGVLDASRGYAEMGVTGTWDMSVLTSMEQSLYDVIDVISRGDEYLQRFIGSTCCIDEAGQVDGRIEKLIEMRKKYDNDRFRFGFLKIINDGTMESRTAANSDPYPEDGSVVQPLFNEEEAAEIGLKAAAAGLDINMHAIGDVAAKSVIAMAKAVREAGYNDTRICCSHSQYVADEDAPKFGEYDIVANTTGVWFYGNPLMDKVLGPVNDLTFRLKTLIDGGARMGLGSDFPVDEYGREPLKSIEMVCTRKLYGQPDGPVLKPYEEKLTVHDGIAGFTINNAYQLHMENKVGSIEVGKYADLVILEKNLFEIPLEEIHKVKVCETILEGKTTYKA